MQWNGGKWIYGLWPLSLQRLGVKPDLRGKKINTHGFFLESPRVTTAVLTALPSGRFHVLDCRDVHCENHISHKAMEKELFQLTQWSKIILAFQARNSCQVLHPQSPNHILRACWTLGILCPLPRQSSELATGPLCARCSQGQWNKTSNKG